MIARSTLRHAASCMRRFRASFLGWLSPPRLVSALGTWLHLFCDVYFVSTPSIEPAGQNFDFTELLSSVYQSPEGQPGQGLGPLLNDCPHALVGSGRVCPEPRRGHQLFRASLAVVLCPLLELTAVIDRVHLVACGEVVRRVFEPLDELLPLLRLSAAAAGDGQACAAMTFQKSRAKRSSCVDK